MTGMAILPPASNDRLIWDTWLSMYRLPVLTVADEVGTLAAICAEAKGTPDLAVELGVDARALEIHLAALAAMGFVVRHGGLWRASAESRMWLNPEATGYCGPAIHHMRSANALHGQLLETLRTGDRSEGHVSAADEWERGEMPPEMARGVTAYMNAHSCAASQAVAMLPEFAGVASLLDVGGGSAIFSIELAKAWDQMRLKVMDIAAVTAEADRYIAEAGLAERVRTQAVNMFIEAWPGGHDAHFLSNIFHDWSDATCRLLAAKSFAALPSGGQIILHEMLMDDDGCGPLPVACFSLLMLLGTRGKQYSFVELKAILESAGFTDIAANPTPQGLYSLVTGRKP